jgi:23S rRNA (uracil1939-C5)-methyltransferase
VYLKKGQVVDVAIEKLAFGGSGIGKCSIPSAILEAQPSSEKANGLITFVPNVVPGDRIKAALTKIKSSHLEASVVEIVEPSPDRIEPRCQHFSVCGGCTWQQLGYEDQLKYKESIVGETMAHLGGFSKEDVSQMMRPIIGCKDPWFYRNKMELSFGVDDEGQIELGFHKPKRRYDVFDLKACFLQSELVAELVQLVITFAREEGLGVFNNKTQDGLLRNLVIREGKNTGEVMVNLVTSINSWPGYKKFKALFETDEWKNRITSLIWTTVIQTPGVPTWSEGQTLLGADVIYEEMALETGERLRFEISPKAFFQPNTKQAEILYGQVIELADLNGDEVVYDLYCGTGTIGLFCAHKSKQVYGIEVSQQAVENARENARRNGIKNAEFVIGDVGKVVGKTVGTVTPPPPDVVIVDPPRSGLVGDVPKQVADLGAQKIIYVSCNPTTLARDLKIFTNELGYTVQSVQPVDMFPQTYHIENVALLVKK